MGHIAHIQQAVSWVVYQSLEEKALLKSPSGLETAGTVLLLSGHAHPVLGQEAGYQLSCRKYNLAGPCLSRGTEKL